MEDLNVFSGVSGNYAFDDGNGTGYNVCLKIDVASKTANFSVLSIKNGAVSGGSYETLKLNGEDFVELSMISATAGVFLSVKTGTSPRSLGNESLLEISAGDAKNFDMKLGKSVSEKVLNPSKKGFALIGGQDTRGNITSMHYVSANLSENSQVVRVQISLSGTGVVGVLFSSKQKITKVEERNKFPIKDIGIPKWGCKMVKI